jgi:DNA helicase-2/ATP-dependent DNA helicase PcrA
MRIYPRAVPTLSPEQARAVAHPPGALLVVGGAGTGKTSVVVERFAHRVQDGTPPESILVLAPSSAAAEALRTRIEDRLEQAWGELCVHDVHGLCARLLRDEAAEAGLDPFFVPATRADRLAMLLDRVSELTLRLHDFRGRPAALLAGVIERIDQLKEQAITAEDAAAWSASLPETGDAQRSRAAREREFAQVYADHDRFLAEEGTLDFGDLLLETIRLLRDKPDVRAHVAERWPVVLADDVHDAGFSAMLLLRLLTADRGDVTVTGDDDQAIERFRGAAAKNLRDFADEHPDGELVRLTESARCPQRVLDAARAVVVPIPDRIGKDLAASPARPPGEVSFWRCTNERAQAQSVAADVERLVARDGVAPERIAVLVRSLEQEGQAVAVALEERAVPYRELGAAALFQRGEVRDVLAWLRLLVDPDDASAVVRALSRPPVDLRSVDVARCVQIARRRKLDMVTGLVAATESPQVTPEARERILQFLKLHRALVEQLDTERPDLFVHRLIERLGLRRQQLFAAQADVVERLVNLARFGELAAAHVRRSPQATPREFGRYVAAVAEAGLAEAEAAPGGRGVRVMAMHDARGREFDHVYVLGLQAARVPGARRRPVEPIPDELLKERLAPDSQDGHVIEMRRLVHLAMTRARKRLVLAYAAASGTGAAQPPSPFAEEARAALHAAWEDRAEELFGPAETLHSTFRMMRDELLDQVQRVGGRLGELRFDTDLDVSHAVVRLMEVLKLSALLARPEDQPVGEALAEVNARLMSAATSEQREILLTSSLDELLLDADRGVRGRAAAVQARAEPSLEAFLPRRGDGLVLSASDIETYRTCPLKYKFARVFRIPAEPTLNQRFGIFVHQVLERWHAGGGEMGELIETAWRRGGFGDSDEEHQLRAKAGGALRRYLERCRAEDGEPTWFERAFTFRLGPHLLRGRVDRVDRLPGGSYELIDYKTGRPKSAAALREDVQLSLYAVGAREAWGVDAAQQAYLYVLDDEKVRVPSEELDRDWITETVMEVGEGILGQGFEPTPSYAACSVCDFRIACPAAEK